MGLDTVIEEVEPGSPNVIAVLPWPGKKVPASCFEGHTDVVTEGDASEWKYGPFEGSLWEAGSTEEEPVIPKGNLAAALYRSSGDQSIGHLLQSKILLGILVDEEGLMNGVKHFITAIRLGPAAFNAVPLSVVTRGQSPLHNPEGSDRAELITSGKMSPWGHAAGRTQSCYAHGLDPGEDKTIGRR